MSSGGDLLLRVHGLLTLVLPLTVTVLPLKDQCALAIPVMVSLLASGSFFPPFRIDVWLVLLPARRLARSARRLARSSARFRLRDHPPLGPHSYFAIRKTWHDEAFLSLPLHNVVLVHSYFAIRKTWHDEVFLSLPLHSVVLVSGASEMHRPNRLDEGVHGKDTTRLRGPARQGPNPTVEAGKLNSEVRVRLGSDAYPVRPILPRLCLAFMTKTAATLMLFITFKTDGAAVAF